MARQRARLNDDNDPLSSTDKVLNKLGQVNKLTSDKPDNLSSTQVGNTESHIPSKSSIYNADNTKSQEVKKLVRKSTFQLDCEILEQLDRLHLKLQLDLGKANAPYKEIIVEEAIARLLFQVDEDKDQVLTSLKKRQSGRD
jgi:hypothetical protein